MQEVTWSANKVFNTSQINKPNKPMVGVKSEELAKNALSAKVSDTLVEKYSIKTMAIFKDILDKSQSGVLDGEELKDILGQVSMNELYQQLSDEGKQFTEKYKLLLQSDELTTSEVMNTFKNDLIFKNNISNNEGVDWLSDVSLVSINLVYIKLYSELILNAAEVVKKQLDAVRDAIALLQALVDFITLIKSKLNEEYVKQQAKDPKNQEQPKWDKIIAQSGENNGSLVLYGDVAPKLLQQYFKNKGSFDGKTIFTIDQKAVILMVQAVLDMTKSALQGTVNLDAHVDGLFQDQAQVQNTASNVNNFIQKAKDKMTSLGSKVPDMANTLRDLDSLFVNSTLSSVRVR